MKHRITTHNTTLEAETLLDVLKLDKLEKVLVAYQHSPMITVKDWSQRPDIKSWGVHTLMYTTEALKEIYDTIGEYVYLDGGR